MVVLNITAMLHISIVSIVDRIISVLGVNISQLAAYY